mmetsp:Transcript_19789/g.37760  ORF Transcript_19789/g.37760 Transcript_19789/m.37760 type:complete len:806 (-) Transcript_19789:371-2788(-)
MGSDSDDDFLDDVDEAEIDEWVSDDDLEALDAELAQEKNSTSAKNTAVDDIGDGLSTVDLDGPSATSDTVMTGPGEQKISSEIEAGEVEDAPYVGEQEPGPFSGLANPLGGLFGQPKPAPPPEEDKEEAATKPAAGGWGGWGRSLMKVSKAVSTAAAGAMEVAQRDLHELQTRVSDMVTPDHGEGQVESESHASTGEEAMAEGEEAGAERAEQDGAAGRREEVLAKLQQAGDDDVIDTRLKALDDQMEHLASNALGVLGGMWGGARKLASSAAAELKQGLEDVKELHVVQVVADSAKGVAAKGGHALEGLGRSALGLLTVQPSGWDQDRSAIDELAPEDVSFERCFYIYGGPEFMEELEQVANQGGVLCNRAQGKLSDAEKAEFHKQLALMQSVLALATPNEKDAEEYPHLHKARASAAARGMLSESMCRAEGLSLAVTGAMKAEMQSAAEGEVPVEEALVLARTHLETVRAEGVRQMSELCTVCVAHLLQFSAHCTGDDELAAADGAEEPAWPPHALDKAHVIRAHARQMVSTLNNVLEVFLSALSNVALAAADAGTSGGEEEHSELKQELAAACATLAADADEMKMDLKCDLESAAQRITDALPHLMQLLLLALLPEHALQGGDDHVACAPSADAELVTVADGSAADDSVADDSAVDDEAADDKAADESAADDEAADESAADDTAEDDSATAPNPSVESSSDQPSTTELVENSTSSDLAANEEEASVAPMAPVNDSVTPSHVPTNQITETVLESQPKVESEPSVDESCANKEDESEEQELAAETPSSPVKSKKNKKKTKGGRR